MIYVFVGLGIAYILLRRKQQVLPYKHADIVTEEAKELHENNDPGETAGGKITL